MGEVDLIMVDIEVLSETDKEEAIRYLEASLDELKQVRNWEIQSRLDENSSEEKIEETTEVQGVASKRLKLELETDFGENFEQTAVNPNTILSAEHDTTRVVEGQPEKDKDLANHLQGTT